MRSYIVGGVSCISEVPCRVLNTESGVRFVQSEDAGVSSGAATTPSALLLSTPFPQPLPPLSLKVIPLSITFRSLLLVESAKEPLILL